MTIREAKSIVDRYEMKSVLSSDEEFLLIEAFNHIIDETKDSDYRLMKEPCKVVFRYNEDDYTVESVREDDGSVSVRFGDKWYRDIDDFFKKAEIDGERIPVLYPFIYALREA